MNNIVSAIMVLLGMFPSQLASTHSNSHRSVIYVQESVTGSFDGALRKAVSFDGRYTRSRLVIHRCDRKHECIRVSQGRITQAGVSGNAFVAAQTTGTHVVANVRSKGLTYGQQVRMFEHELGHALGLGHNPRCTSVMYYKLTCHGHLSPQTFDYDERQVLKNR
jgi:hypothetical protein